MDKIPSSIRDWLNSLRAKEPVTVSSVERRLIYDFMKQPVVMEVWRQIVLDVDGKMERLRVLNMLDQAEAAEALRIQGMDQALMQLAETFWENTRNEG